MSNVLVMTVPAAQEEDIFTIRGYVLECLRLGVLIIGKGVSWEVVDVPELGGVVVRDDPKPLANDVGVKAEDDEDPMPKNAAATAEHEESVDAEVWEAVTPRTKFMGPRAAEKRKIHGRLAAYREAHGLGSFSPLIAASGGQLSESDLYMAISCEPLDMETWRRIGLALDAAGG